MIQRIQSVYLFLAVIALVAMFFFPLANFYGDMYYFFLSLDGVSDETIGRINTIPLIVMAGVLIALIFSGIFSYKNRMFQVRLVRFAVLLNIAFIIIIYFGYIDNIVKDSAKQNAILEVQYKAGIYFPLIVLVFLILAIRGVMQDEKKVRAADRLR
jgi:hypothetical protein